MDTNARPFLRLNTEMHTADIKRIDVDRRGKILVTASTDKTVKVWDLRNGGQLLRTLRPPIGDGNEGMLYAVALSPDGRTVATGGWTKGGSSSNHIYLFDVATGKLLRNIAGHENVILHLCYAPNGQHLAATLGGTQGLRVYETQGWTSVAEDRDYGSDSYSCAFGPWGHLVTVCDDGYLRRYDPAFSLIKKVKAPDGKRPFSIALAPDGNRLAVGYTDSPRVSLLAADTLEKTGSPVITDADTLEHRLDSVTFSADGQTLFAGGFAKKIIDGRYLFFIRAWHTADTSRYQDIPVASNTILQLVALPDGSVAFGGFRPDWGIIAPDRQVPIYRGVEAYDWVAKDKSHFCVSPGGGTLGATPYSLLPLRFTVAGRSIAQTAADFPHYQTSAGGIEITDWAGSYDPRCNGRSLGEHLEEFERCICVDVATGGQGFVLGADFILYAFDAWGQPRWQQATQTMVCATKIDDYRLVVAAACSDGTLRWYNYQTGEHLLNLFLHPDGERWILWTPSGYYDASAGAEELIGWHVNRGPEREAEFYPAAHFRSKYYRPDVIDLILDTLNEEQAVAEANAKRQGRLPAAPADIQAILPPTVRIHSPQPNTSFSQGKIKLRYQVESPNDEALQTLIVQVDGRPERTLRDLPVGDQLREVEVELPAADCTVSLVAENRHGASDPATVRLQWRGQAAAAATGVNTRPKLYVLSIGVSEYAHQKVNNLRLAHKDARDFAAAVQRQQGQLFREVEVRCFTDQDADKDNILDGLDWLQRQTTHRDVAMLYFAGHGHDDNARNFYFLPHGADPAHVRRTCVAKGEIQSMVATVAGKIVVFLDACHSGGVMQDYQRRDLPPDVIGVVNELISAENGAIVFSSSTTRQYSLEQPEWDNGAFTKALVEGLNGAAPTIGGQKITVRSLDAYVAERVKVITGGKQSPTTQYPANVPDFPIGIC